MTDRIDVPSTLWYNELPQTPKVQETTDEVAFAVVPGRSQKGPTVVLAGRYYVQPPILDYYGGQLPRPVRVVAIDAQTGAVFSEELITGRSPPVFVMVPEGAPPSGGGRASEGTFNVDLPAHVGLPPRAATYHVFLWLDHVLSAVEVVTLDENAQRTPAPLSFRKPDAVLQLGAKHTLAADPGAIALRATAKPRSREVEGAWTPDPARLADRKTPYVLTVLAFNHRDRSFGWAAADLHALPAGTDPARFELDAGALTGAAPGEQKVFVLAFAGGKLSKALVLPSS
jgi:hypothetical protein